MSANSFKAKPYTIGSEVILHLPKEASLQLPSRGMVYVKGSINGIPFESPLEPDGRGSHWFRIDAALQKTAKVKAGDTATLEIEPIKDWPEPKVPEDLEQALKSSPKEHELWKNVTPMARWDWIRWISSTKNPDTRKKRIDVELSKLKKGMKRPCCFNRSLCCDPSVSKNGVLLEPNQA